MPQVKLNQRFGDHQPGDTVDVDETTAEWLVGINYGTTKDSQGPQQRAFAEGTDGADKLAGGDPTRRYGHVIPKNQPTHNDALPVPGSPIQYNAGVADGDYPGKPAEQDKPRASGRSQPAKGGSARSRG